ncbi:MAG: hypothetical protein E6K60_03270 [Nitrospirae bacterium]|nr:MAG: hypothetical protein E6K60_03270 [Nitrospirota bacterium]
MSRQLSPFLIFFLLLFAVEGALISAAAKEVFKDEAGRVIYTIDENGIVSMFENSPTDLTLSVKRGTVEQMRPRLEGVAPATVAAGSSTTLKLRGKNLVGAKVMLGVRQIEMGAYLGLPAMVEVPIQVPANFPPGDVAITVTTPIGITVGSFKVTGPRQVQSGSPNPRDNSKQVISTDAPASCPEGMMGVAAERGGFCIETDQTFSGDLRDAEKICAIAGKRLCVASEWREACEQTQKGRIALKNMLGDWEWTASIGKAFPLSAILLGEKDCASERLYQPWKSEAITGRCCK